MNFPRMRPPLLNLLTGLSVVFALAGCATRPAAAPETTVAPDPARQLRLGMKAAEIEVLMGKPAEIRKFPSESGDVVVWIYHRELPARVETVAPTVSEVPWVDPITGELKAEIVPQTSEQRTERIEEISVYLAGDVLAEVRRTVRHHRSFSP